MSSARIALTVLALVLAGCAIRAPSPPGRHTFVNGTVVTPEGPIADGWLEIRDGAIVAVRRLPPASTAGATVVRTRDHVYPAFVDLHNHPAYNIIPRWADPRTFDNRYQWRRDAKHRAELADPAVAVQRGDFCSVLHYVEIKALVGGTGSTNGLSPPSRGGPMPGCVVGLVRNLDWHTGFHGKEAGNERVRNLIGVVGADLRPGVADELRQQLQSGALDLLTVHLAEGRASDRDTRAEFGLLVGLGLLTERTAIVHGIALGPGEFGRMREARAALVWSPRSNMQLYGETTDVLAAMDAGVAVALSPDWSPTGSDGMLDEIAFAATLARSRLGGRPTARQLFEMSTSVPARIARLDGRIGSLTPGRRADLFLLPATHADPFEALVSAKTADISLVLVDGEPAYGDPERMEAFGLPRLESLTVCGRTKQLNAALLPEPLADIARRLARSLAQHGAALAELAECR